MKSKFRGKIFVNTALYVEINIDSWLNEQPLHDQKITAKDFVTNTKMLTYNFRQQ